MLIWLVDRTFLSDRAKTNSYVFSLLDWLKKKEIEIKAPEIKLIILILYLSILELYNVITTSTVISHENGPGILDYFLCETAGVDAMCSKSVLKSLESDKIAIEVIYILISLLPCVFLVFFLDLSKLPIRKRPKRTNTLFLVSESETKTNMVQ